MINVAHSFIESQSYYGRNDKSSLVDPALLVILWWQAQLQPTLYPFLVHVTFPITPLITWLTVVK